VPDPPRPRRPVRPMEVRELGRSGLRGTPMGLGLAALGRPGYLNLGHAAALGEDRDVEALRRRTWDVLDAAWRAGVRWFDAARSYGLAEDFLSSWLAAREIAPGRLTVSSKWGYTYTAGWRSQADVHEVKDHSAGTLRVQVEETRGRIGDWLDLYQIHSATLETGVLTDRAVLTQLLTLADTGTAVGLSVSGPGQAATVRQALTTSVDGRNPFTAVQATWNLLEPSAGPALQAAADAGWAVLVKEGMANGRLAPGGDAHLSARQLAALDRVCARAGATRDAVALAAVLAQPWAGVVLSGASTVSQLHSNLGALHATLTAADLEELATLAEPVEGYWSTRSALPWT
jgi:aryl-alcohol dehydrogenase-like predicted oxidoreductase